MGYPNLHDYVLQRSSLNLEMKIRSISYFFHKRKCVLGSWSSNCSLIVQIFFSFHRSFSTAYQCIYYSPQHIAKAQEVLSTVSLLQPLITSLADQLLHAALEHSSPGLKDALKSLSDKVSQHQNL